MSARVLASAIALAAASLSAAPVTAQTADPNHVFGPELDWSTFKKLAEASIGSRLVDPESARFTWISGYAKGVFKPFLARRVHGYVACGTVNARNRMGGYAGAKTFVVAIDFGRVIYSELDTYATGMQSELCAQGIAAGRFPPVPASENAAPGDVAAAKPDISATVSAASGLTVRAMPEGAYVAGVTSGSIAATAGLTPGMVITSVNGLSLSEMGDAMTKVVAAAGPGATLTIIGGKTITLAGVR